MNTPSAEQLARAMRTMPRHSLEAKMASGELTALGRTVAAEELSRRDKEGEPTQDATTEFAGGDAAESATAPEVAGDGWSKVTWLVAFGIALLVILAFGSTARNKADQSFLYAVIIVQASILAGLFRVLASIFSSRSSLSWAGKLVAVGGMSFALFALTLCSGMAQTGWRGG
jgi:hypothetical protein